MLCTRQRRREKAIKQYGKIKKSRWIVLLLAVAVMTLGMLAVFVSFSENIYNKTLKKEIQNLELSSGYITKIIRLEVEHCVEVLETSEEILDVSEDSLRNQTQEILQKIKARTDFNSIGIVGLDGQSIDDDGDVGGLSDAEFLRKIKNDEYYISDMLTSGEKELGQILVAVPLHNGDDIVGAIWGQYPVSAIAEKIEVTGKSDIYFQLIDNQGNYISRSENQNALAEGKPLWEELKSYELCDGVTIDSIKKNVENHKSGTFYLNYHGKGRYVTYEPLGISNWYVFSVLVEDSINAYVNEISHHSVNLLIYFSVFMVILFCIIGTMVRQGMRMIKKQNQQLLVKTQLFRMILSKTKDVPFEFDLKEKRMKIYHHDLPQESGEECEIIENFSLDTLDAAQRIREEDIERYRKMYEDSIIGKEVEPQIFKLKVKNDWEWDRLHLLMADTENMVGFFENYEEQIEKNKKIEELNYKTKHDVLTGVYNRGSFIEEVEAYLEKPRSQWEMSALFLLDLDNFKELNDSLGHIAGDQALEDVVVNLQSVKRDGDVIGRIGGDEFMLFMKYADDIASVHEYAGTLNRALQKEYGEQENRVTVSVSIGIAIIQEETSFAELYKKADTALYKVKKSRRNGYRIE